MEIVFIKAYQRVNDFIDWFGENRRTLYDLRNANLSLVVSVWSPKMIILIKILVLVSLFQIGYCNLTCSENSACRCSPGWPLSYNCSQAMTILITKNADVFIFCESMEKRFESELLADIDFGKVEKFSIQKCQLLQKDIESIANKLDTKTVKEISITGNKVESIKSDFFKKFVHLERIQIDLNFLLKLDENTFGDLSFLKYIDLMGNNIEHIPNRIFEKLTNLEDLYLPFNNISALGSRSFSGLWNLKQLDLSDNQLETINSDTFSKLSKLERIHLSQNKLQNLSPELFQNNKQLKEILLANNKPLELPDYFFANLSLLETIDLSRNDIQALPKHVFQNLKALRKINLSMNQLSKIEFQLFQIHGTQPYNLNLAFNSITEINYRQVENTENVKHISLLLHKNNITCSCSNYNFLTHVQRQEELGSNKNQILQVEGLKFPCKNITQLLNLGCSV